MANPEHVEVVKQGAAAIAQWRQRHPQEPLDLDCASLEGVSLACADLSAATFRGADLKKASFYLANMMRADLTNARLKEAMLAVANMTFTNLTNARLEGALLAYTHLIDPTLTGANFTGARFISASFLDCDLAQCVGLETAVHHVPSGIGVNTLARSFRTAGDRLTPELETFFLNAGVPKELLSALPQIMAQVKYCTCFVCYGEPDLAFATKLVRDLKATGVPCWLYPMDYTPGEKTWPEIGRKRREADKMIVLCSAAALVRDGALKEIEAQIDEDPDKMLPISLDELWRQPGFLVQRGRRDLKLFLLQRNYVDFSDDSKYKESLAKLLEGLKRQSR